MKQGPNSCSICWDIEIKGFLLLSLHISENPANSHKKFIFTAFLRNKMLHKSDYEQYTNRPLQKKKPFRIQTGIKQDGLVHVSATVEFSDSEYGTKLILRKCILYVL